MKMGAVYRIVSTPRFDREIEKLSEEDKEKVLDTIRILAENPHYPSLRTKKYRKVYESSVNMDIRILWRFDEHPVIIALRVGHHNIVKKLNKRKSGL